MAGFENDVLLCSNVNFNPALPKPHTGLITTNGQLIIGSTALNAGGTHLNIGVLTSPLGTITIGYSSPNITLDTNGLNCSYTNVTHAMSPYTVVPTDCYISVDCSGGVVTLKFPDSPTFKQTWIIKDRTGNAAVSNISVTTVSGARTFDGLTTYTINSNFQAIQLLANNSSNYEVY